MAQEDPKGKAGADWAGQTKWVVLGVVALTALFLFRPEIGNVLGNASEIKVSKDGVTIKTTQTKLGAAEVSNVSIKASAAQADGIQGSVFTSRQHGFQISWPASGWSASETMGPAMLAQQPGLPPTLAIPLVLLRNEPVGNFRPNVNVVVEQIGNMSLADYFKASIGALRQQGWQVLTEDLDEKSQGAFASYLNESTGTRVYQFARIAVSNGKGYVITASQLPLDDGASDPLRAGLLGILNSFRTISGP